MCQRVPSLLFSLLGIPGEFIFFPSCFVCSHCCEPIKRSAVKHGRIHSVFNCCGPGGGLFGLAQI